MVGKTTSDEKKNRLISAERPG